MFHQNIFIHEKKKFAESKHLEAKKGPKTNTSKNA